MLGVHVRQHRHREAGRRLTIYSITINQFSEKAAIVKKLIFESKARGIHISIVLLDRAFYTVDVIEALKSLGVYFIFRQLRMTPSKKQCVITMRSSQ
jgi:hypothetical protein